MREFTLMIWDYPTGKACRIRKVEWVLRSWVKTLGAWFFAPGWSFWFVDGWIHSGFLPACTSREIPTLCWVLFTFSPAWIFTKLHQLHSATSLWTLCHHPSDSAATLRRKAEVRLHLNDFTRAIAACRRWHAVGRMYGSTQRHSDKIWWLLLYIYIYHWCLITYY